MSQAISRAFAPGTSSRIRAPAHLSEAAKRWWRSIMQDFDLEAHHVAILTAAAEAFDRKEEARRLIAKEGLVIRDGSGGPMAHPAVQIEEAAATRMARLIREIGLDGMSGADVRVP